MSAWPRNSFTWEPRTPYACATCGTVSPPLQCLRCRLAYYCHVSCQVADFEPRHQAPCHAAARDATLETALRMAANGGRQGSVLGFLWQDEVLGLRAASRACREAVAAHEWGDFDKDNGKRSHIGGSLAFWRACFPKAVAANIRDNKTVTDADFVHLRGLVLLLMNGCNQETITDAAFAHLRGIYSLHMGGCNQSAITDAAFAHLQGIRALNMNNCSQATISDAAFAHLRGI